MLIMLAMLLLQKVQKICSFFQIMPKIMLAQSISSHTKGGIISYSNLNVYVEPTTESYHQRKLQSPLH